MFVDPQGVQTHKSLMEINYICRGPRVFCVPLRICISIWVGFSPVHPCRGDFERVVWLQNQGSSLRRRFFPRKRLFKEEGDKTNVLTSTPKDGSILAETGSQITTSMILPTWLLVGPELEPTSSDLADRCSLN